MKKKIYLSIISFLFALFICGCKTTTTQANPPQIIGAQNVSLTVGQRFIPLNGISAVDASGNAIDSDNIAYSGNVDINTPGTYQATYTVTDSNGVSASVTITVTVEAPDTESPLLTGANDCSVVVTSAFDSLNGVSANDTVDGNVTSAITVTGTVDTKHVGEYELTYTVSDAAGNTTTKVRTVTVGEGEFVFDDTNKVETASVTKTMKTDSEYSFGLVKVSYTTTEANKEVTVSLGTYEVKTTHATAGTYTAYLSYTSDLSNAQITVNGATFVSYIVGDDKDTVAPVFSGDFTQTVAISKDHKDSAAQFIIDMLGVKARDNKDGYITSQITFDQTGVNWESTEEQNAKITVTDSSGNKAEQAVKVIVNGEKAVADLFDDLEAIANDNACTNAPLSDTYRNMTLNKVTADGQDKDAIQITDLTSGGYWSYGMIRYILTDTVKSGNYYVLKITARAALEDSQGQLTQGISFRIGAQLAADPWYYEFKGCSVGGSTYGENRISLTQEYQTFYRVFKADLRDSTQSIEDAIGVAMEFHLTPQEWVTVYDVYVKDFSISLLSNEDQVPELTQDTTKPLVYVVGDTVDLTTYFTATDIEDGALTVQTEGTVNTAAKGTYTVKFYVTDSAQHKVEKSLTFEVLNAKDTTKPTITLSQELPEDFLIDEYTTEQFKALVAQIVQITDTKDGETYDIAFADATVDWGNLDMSQKGKYTVSVTAKDSSGNTQTLTKEIVVVKERVTEKYEYDQVLDLTPTADGKVGTATLHTIENVTITEANGAMVITPAEGITSNQWASYCKLKYAGLQGSFEYGKTYTVKIKAKADQARKVQTTFVKDWSTTLQKCVFNLTDEYQELSMDFVYTGKSVYNLDMEFHFGQIDYEGSATASNKIYIISVEIYEHYTVVQNNDLVLDMTPTADGKVGTTTLHTVENVTVSVADNVSTITPAEGITSNQWASYCKLKYAGIHSKLENGKTYKIILKAKADQARKIQATLVKDWSSTIEKSVFNLTDEYQELSYEFTYDSTGIGNLDLEFHFGQIDYEGSATASNKVYIEYFKLVECENSHQTVDLVKDLTPTADGKRSDVTIHTVENVTVTVENGVSKVTPVAASDESSNRYASYSKLKYAQINSFLEDGTTYRIVLVAKADQARTIQTAYVKDWSTTLFKHTYALTDEYQTFTYEFTYTASGIYCLDCEFQFGAIDGSENCTSTNNVYIKSFDLFEVKSYGIKKVGQKYSLLSNGTTYSDGNSVTFTTLDSGEYECSTVKSKYFGIKSFVVPSYAKYFVFTLESSIASHNISAKVDNSDNAYNSKQINFNVVGETTKVIDLSTLKADLDPTTLVKFCMWSYSDTGAKIIIKEAYFTDTDPTE